MMRDEDLGPPQRRWWREPVMWLVVGGPAVVVLAAIVTAVIAIDGADPVLDTREPTAMQSRNHAVTPGGAPHPGSAATP